MRPVSGEGLDCLHAGPDHAGGIPVPEDPPSVSQSMVEVTRQSGAQMKWFKHDSDAHRDAKLRRVMMKYGMEGYGLYWHCLELIAGAVDQHNLTFELEHDAEIIAHDTGIHYERVQEMIGYMVSLGLFENDGGIITCMKLAKRLDKSMTSNQEMRNVIKQLSESNDATIMTQSGQNHDAVMIPSEQKRREEKRRDKKHMAHSGHAYSEEFENAWRAYPSRGSNNPKKRAFKVWNARLREGHTPEEMTKGIKQYAAWVKAEGCEGTAYVKQAATFLGPDKFFQETWKVQQSKDPFVGAL